LPAAHFELSWGGLPEGEKLRRDIAEPGKDIPFPAFGKGGGGVEERLELAQPGPEKEKVKPCENIVSDILQPLDIVHPEACWARPTVLGLRQH
jgi:hypothetical protein